jgi:enoyl-CoA hydratase/carnithine racemase
MDRAPWALLLVLVGASASAADALEVDLYAYCDASPRLDGVKRALSLAATRRGPSLELVAVSLRPRRGQASQRALRVEATGLPATWRAWYPEALCAGPLAVELTVRDVKTGRRRTEAITVVVQQVD